MSLPSSSRAGIALVVMAAVATAASVAPSFGCRKRRAPGTCVEDLDCPPAFDCRAGHCVHRERMRFDQPSKIPTPAATEPTPAADPEPFIPVPGQVQPDAGAPAAPAAPAVKRPPPPAERPPDPTPSYPTSPTPGREPMWKQRRKNI